MNVNEILHKWKRKRLCFNTEICVSQIVLGTEITEFHDLLLQLNGTADINIL